MQRFVEGSEMGCWGLGSLDLDPMPSNGSLASRIWLHLAALSSWGQSSPRGRVRSKGVLPRFLPFLHSRNSASVGG